MQLNHITQKWKIIVVRASCPHMGYKLDASQLSNTARLRRFVGWVEALRNSTKAYECWVEWSYPTYELSDFLAEPSSIGSGRGSGGGKYRNGY